MVTNIHLDVVSGEVEAIEKGKPQWKGHFAANGKSTVRWQGKYTGGTGSFVVKFRVNHKLGNCGWPFDDIVPPSNLELHVPAQGSVDKKLLAGDANWWYEVFYPGAKELDPMMIIRGASLSQAVLLYVLAAAVAAFVAGVVVGTSIA
jgi:hypothetical protein